jgi:hypothetical protein
VIFKERKKKKLPNDASQASMRPRVNVGDGDGDDARGKKKEWVSLMDGATVRV